MVNNMHRLMCRVSVVDRPNRRYE